MEPPTTTLHVNTQMVLVDVAVVDKKGRPATSVLGRDDFAITEDGKPQSLLSFESPKPHSESTKTIVVLDELNMGAADKAYYLVCFEQYLRSLPETLSVPAELMVLTASSLKIVQPFTRSRGELLSALVHLPASGATLANLQQEHFPKTLSALNSIALENLGDPTRTAVLWLGPGYGVDLNSQPYMSRPDTERFIRYMANTLLEGRTTLYVIFPPDYAGEPSSQANLFKSVDLIGTDPYNGGIDFRTLAAQTGGSVYIATNDLAAAMRHALDFGRGIYTLGYRPDSTVMDGRFRRIRVVLRNPNLRVVTKSGYYAPELQEQDAPQTVQVFQMTEAGKSTLPFRGIPLQITHIDRALDGKSAEFTIEAQGDRLPWRPEGQQESLAELTVGGLSLSKQEKKLSSHFRNVNMMARSQDPTVLHQTTALFKLTLELPSNTDRVRLIVSSRKNGQLGCVDVSRAAIEAASATAITRVYDR